ncbi:MAG: tRNA (N6-isopentenyl adenosine(37)-C2)-methylthiotransferase MiaB [Vicingaceae bacterium]
MEKLIDESRQGEVLVLENTEGVNKSKKVYIESYGCQMNFSDSEIVASILSGVGYETTRNIEDANAIFLNTCSIRDKAERTVRQRISTLRKQKERDSDLVIGVLGCMAERMKHQLLEEEKLVDIVVGPDAYRDLPNLMEIAEDGRKAVNVILSKEETYADITPVRLDSNGVNAFVSIMRGCDNMCTFCVVPFTRGRERSRDPETIVTEARSLFDQGYREITLLGQNVDSYLWYGGGLKKAFSNLSEEEKKNSMNFAQLLRNVAEIDSGLRIRFSTSHPKDMTDEVLEVMAAYDNICDYIHLPFQSGNSDVLERMNRGYSREWYLDRISAIRRILPECAISADVITGFCGETEAEHEETLSLMREVKFSFSYMFKYSERPKTLAQRKFIDDISEEIKQHRLAQIIDLQMTHSAERSREFLDKTCEVLVEGTSKKDKNFLSGRNSQNTTVVFPKEDYKPGDYVMVHIENCTATTLIGKAIRK